MNKDIELIREAADVYEGKYVELSTTYLDSQADKLRALADRMEARGKQASVAFVDRKYPPACVGWHLSMLPKDGTQLYLHADTGEVERLKRQRQILWDANKKHKDRMVMAEIQLSTIKQAVENNGKIVKFGEDMVSVYRSTWQSILNTINAPVQEEKK